MTVATGTNLSRRVAAEVRAALGRLDLRQSDLARRMGRNEEWVSTRLKGPTVISVNDLEAFAAALGVEIVDLLPRAVAETPRTLGYPEIGIGSSLTAPRNSRPPSYPSGRNSPSRTGRTHRPAA